MAKTTKTLRKTVPAGIGKVFKRLHYPPDVILLCVRWYVAYSLSLRNLKEMMAEWSRRGPFDGAPLGDQTRAAV